VPVEEVADSGYEEDDIDRLLDQLPNDDEPGLAR
jgi:hypothetical protein